MTYTYLYGLDDSDVPDEFIDELDRAAWLEWRAEPTVLFNALLTAGWVPPSKAKAPAPTRRDWQACGRGICAAEEGHPGSCVKG